MEMEGKWIKDEDGYMEFYPQELQRLYEAVTDRYHQVYNNYLDEYDDDDEAYYKALNDGYEMVTDYKVINDKEEFATTYTPLSTCSISGMSWMNLRTSVFMTKAISELAANSF